MTTLQDTSTIHRYSCTIHDGEGCDGHCGATPEQLIHQYADLLAEFLKEDPTTTITRFADQCGTAGLRLDDAGIDGAEALADAGIFLHDLDEASQLTGITREVLLERSRNTLRDLPGMVGQFRQADPDHEAGEDLRPGECIDTA